jgi:tripartite-type tricarboxylate transporter receptor subunit TctC
MHQNRFSRRQALSCAGALAVAALPLRVRAQLAYPDRQIQMVVPFAPGGAVDVVARLVAAGMTEVGKQSVVVENRTGAGGNIGLAYVAKAAKDGYTFVMASTGTAVNGSLYKKLNYDPAHDLEPVAMVGRSPTVLLANPKLPVKNLAEIVALAKSRPDTVNFAHGGAGTTEHLAAVMFNQREGVAIPTVAYRGGGPALTDLIGGQVQLMFTNLLNALPYLQAGTLKAIAIASEQRSARLPDVPTCAELGLPDFYADVWWGVMGPSGMPQAVVDKANSIINAVVSTPEFAQKLAAIGGVPKPESVAAFKAMFDSEVKRWAAVVKAGNIQLD